MALIHFLPITVPRPPEDAHLGSPSGQPSRCRRGDLRPHRRLLSSLGHHHQRWRLDPTQWPPASLAGVLLGDLSNLAKMLRCAGNDSISTIKAGDGPDAITFRVYTSEDPPLQDLGILAEELLNVVRCGQISPSS